jgi:hypothetical protein
MFRTIVLRRENTKPLNATRNMPRQTAGSRNTRIRACRCANANRRRITFEIAIFGFTSVDRGLHGTPQEFMCGGVNGESRTIP